MPARTKRRAKFDFRGRPFVWWVDGDRLLRIASLDKQFVVAFTLVRDTGCPPILTVHGQEFPGLDSPEQRPIDLLTIEPEGDSLGAIVDQLLQWSFDDTRELIRAERLSGREKQ